MKLACKYSYRIWEEAPISQAMRLIGGRFTHGKTRRICAFSYGLAKTLPVTEKMDGSRGD